MGRSGQTQRSCPQWTVGRLPALIAAPRPHILKVALGTPEGIALGSGFPVPGAAHQWRRCPKLLAVRMLHGAASGLARACSRAVIRI